MTCAEGPISSKRVESRLRQHRILGLRGRTAALRQIILQTLPPVVAKMLGYNPDHTVRLVTKAGGTWTRYAASDHNPR